MAWQGEARRGVAGQLHAVGPAGQPPAPFHPRFPTSRAGVPHSKLTAILVTRSVGPQPRARRGPGRQHGLRCAPHGSGGGLLWAASARARLGSRGASHHHGLWAARGVGGFHVNATPSDAASARPTRSSPTEDFCRRKGTRRADGDATRLTPLPVAPRIVTGQ